MIARIWKGETPGSKAEQYFDLLKVTGIKAITTPRQDAPVLQPGEEWRIPYEAAWEGLSCPYRTPIL
jgi:hypothetical protein